MEKQKKFLTQKVLVNNRIDKIKKNKTAFINQDNRHKSWR